MRVASFLAVLGCLLALCLTATHAYQPTSTARVGLEKRMPSRLEEAWTQLADKASAFVRGLSSNEHGVLPDNPVGVNLVLRPGEDGTNAGLASRLSLSRIATDNLKAERKVAFNALMDLVYNRKPGSSNPAYPVFLAKFRIAANAYDVLTRAHFLRERERSTIADLDTVLLPRDLFSKFQGEMWMRSRRLAGLTVQEIESLEHDFGQLKPRVETTRRYLSDLRRRYDQHDSIQFVLEDLEQDLARLHTFIDTADFALFQHKRDLPLESLLREASHGSTQQYTGRYVDEDDELWGHAREQRRQDMIERGERRMNPREERLRRGMIERGRRLREDRIESMMRARERRPREGP